MRLWQLDFNNILSSELNIDHVRMPWPLPFYLISKATNPINPITFYEHEPHTNHKISPWDRSVGFISKTKKKKKDDHSFSSAFDGVGNPGKIQFFQNKHD